LSTPHPVQPPEASLRTTLRALAPLALRLVKLVEVSASGIKFGTVGFEIVLLYLAGLAAIALGGAGRYSVDAWRAARKG
jgi:uncharacterized membrane protein YphA (DoxX/SURF4 family)